MNYQEYFPPIIRPFLHFTVIKAIFILLDILCVIGIFYSVKQFYKYRPRLSLRTEPERKMFTLGDARMQERWEGILKKFATGAVESMKFSIVEADSMVDDVLKRLGMEGEHMADRLEHLSVDEISSLNRLWAAHRLRNNIVHSPGFDISPSQAERALEDYEAFLKEVGALKEIKE